MTRPYLDRLRLRPEPPRAELELLAPLHPTREVASPSPSFAVDHAVRHDVGDTVVVDVIECGEGHVRVAWTPELDALFEIVEAC